MLALNPQAIQSTQHNVALQYNICTTKISNLLYLHMQPMQVAWLLHIYSQSPCIIIHILKQFALHSVSQELSF